MTVSIVRHGPQVVGCLQPVHLPRLDLCEIEDADAQNGQGTRLRVAQEFSNHLGGDDVPVAVRLIHLAHPRLIRVVTGLQGGDSGGLTINN